MKFSQRIGAAPTKSVLQVENVDDELRNRLWNTIYDDFLEKLNTESHFNEETHKGAICRIIWKEFFNLRINLIPTYSNGNVYTSLVGSQIHDWFYNAKWYEVYDFLEFLSSLEENINYIDFTEQCNVALAKEVAGYRIINGQVVQITSDLEINEIEEANNRSDKYNSVKTHLDTALKLLADRKTPNYRNSIKESISAVESLCKIITKDDNTTLGKALSEIEKKHKLHGALKSAFSAIYGYSSDSSGIRHALLESDSEVDFTEAKFMLVTCSAFINYLIAKYTN